MKFRLSLELHVTRHKPNKPEPEADHKPEPGEDHQPEDENYATTERADTKPTREASTIGFIVEPYE